MTRLQCTSYLRGLLGRRYSVADEEGGVDGSLRLLVLRRGVDRPLLVETAEGWLRGMGLPPAREDRMLLKHLAIYVRRFFAHPEYLPGGAFRWPGTAQSRGAIRVALDPRHARRAAPPPANGGG